MSDNEPPRVFLLQVFASVWISIVITCGILFGFLTGLPKALLAVILLVVGSPGMLAYSVARRRRRKYHQRLVDEAFSDVRRGPLT